VGSDASALWRATLGAKDHTGVGAKVAVNRVTAGNGNTRWSPERGRESGKRQGRASELPGVIARQRDGSIRSLTLVPLRRSQRAARRAWLYPHCRNNSSKPASSTITGIEQASVGEMWTWAI
jgi:hypothetical protein